MFSVVIPLYNKCDSISSTVESVLHQTFQKFEIVIVDDGSTDNSFEIVNTIADNRIKVFKKENSGVSSARNFGIEKASYEWIALLDGDDLWEKNHLEQIKMMMVQFPCESVFATSFRYSNASISPKGIDGYGTYIVKNYFKEALSSPVIWSSCVVINKSVFDKIGNFNPLLSRGEDLELWARIAREFPIVKSKRITAVYRIEAENRSNGSFELSKTNVYCYCFSMAQSECEVEYYKKLILNVMVSLFLKKKFNDFVKLQRRHRKNISLYDISRFAIKRLMDRLRMLSR